MANKPVLFYGIEHLVAAGVSDIGPFTSLADGVVIEDATVEHCIVLQGARIEHLTGRLEASLVGRQARVYGVAAEPRAHHLMIGDRSSVGIGE